MKYRNPERRALRQTVAASMRSASLLIWPTALACLAAIDREVRQRGLEEFADA
jgi:hypothetical protein